MRVTLILMSGAAIIAAFTAYYSYCPLPPGATALDAASRVMVCAVLLYTITLLYLEAKKNDQL